MVNILNCKIMLNKGHSFSKIKSKAQEQCYNSNSEGGNTTSKKTREFTNVQSLAPSTDNVTQ